MTVDRLRRMETLTSGGAYARALELRQTVLADSEGHPNNGSSWAAARMNTTRVHTGPAPAVNLTAPLDQREGSRCRPASTATALTTHRIGPCLFPAAFPSSNRNLGMHELFR